MVLAEIVQTPVVVWYCARHDVVNPPMLITPQDAGDKDKVLNLMMSTLLAHAPAVASGWHGAANGSRPPTYRSTAISGTSAW